MSDDRTRRERLSATFDDAAGIYERARPEYPAELLDELIAVAGLRPGARLLEIGCATGKATWPLARAGFRITCVERGPRLAAVARERLAAFGVEVVEARFEDWVPGAGDVFDCVCAATAWHWLDPEVRYRKAWSVLCPEGHLAFWDAVHVIPVDGDPFFEEIQDVYAQIGEGLPADSQLPRPQALPDKADEIGASGFFEVVHVRQFDWEVSYDAEGYIELLDTFSGHILMDAWKRERLYGEIRARLSRRADGLLRRQWGGVLHIARRRS